MDEPFSHLDAITARKLRAEHMEILALARPTILFVTHDLSEAVFLSDNIYMMSTKPARIFKRVTIDVARPRKLDEPALFDLEKTLVREFFSVVEAQCLNGVQPSQHRPARSLDRGAHPAVVGGRRGDARSPKFCRRRSLSLKRSQRSAHAGPEGGIRPITTSVSRSARIFVAFAASMIAGIGIGLAMGLNRLFERSLLALIPLMLTTPTILMVFVAIMWFGYSGAGHSLQSWRWLRPSLP